MMELTWFKNGLLFGIVSLLITIITVYFFPINFMILSVLLIAIYIYFIIHPAREERAKQGGYLSYVNTLMVTSSTLLFATLLSTIFGLVMNAVSPDFGERVIQNSIDGTVKMLEMFGMPADKMEEQVDLMRSQMEGMFTPTQQILSFFKSALVIIIICSIFSIFLKKDKEEEKYL